MKTAFLCIVAVIIIGVCGCKASGLSKNDVFIRARRTSQGALSVAGATAKASGSKRAGRQGGAPPCWKGVEHGAACGGITGPCLKHSPELNKFLTCSCDIGSLQYRCH